jgi:hypothetical protein
MVWVTKRNRLRFGRYITSMKVLGNLCTALIMKPEGKIPDERPMHRFVNDTDINLEEVKQCCDLNVSGSGYVPMANTTMNFWASIS